MVYSQDKNITKSIPGYRRMLNHLTPTRNDASVCLNQTLDVTKTLAWIDDERERTGKKITFLHVFTAFAGRLLHDNPGLNRYVCGPRFYQRDGVTVSVSVKKKLEKGAKIVLLKVPIENNDSVEAVRDRFSKLLGEGRSGKEIHQEKEVGLFLKLPPFLLSLCIKLMRVADRWHLLPDFFVEPDPLYTSLVVANVGTVGLDAIYHHLYEYGNCPFFAAIGRIRDEDHKGQVRKMVDIKYTFDERIEDGLACAIGLAGLKELLENPEKLETGLTDLEGKPPESVSAA